MQEGDRKRKAEQGHVPGWAAGRRRPERPASVWRPKNPRGWVLMAGQQEVWRWGSGETGRTWSGTQGGAELLLNSVQSLPLPLSPAQNTTPYAS